MAPQNACQSATDAARNRLVPRDCLVVVPTYNERANLASLVTVLLALDAPLEVLVVDDDSPDGTGVIADDLAAADPRVHVLHRRGRRGLGTAYVEGFAWALERGHGRVVQMDADFSHDPADVPRLIDLSREGGGCIVVGSRYVGGIRVMNWSIGRLALSVAAGAYVRLVTGMGLSDPTSGFRCFPADLLRRLDPSEVASNGYSFQIETTHRAWRRGLPIRELPIVFTERREGASKMSWGIALEAAGMAWRLWWQNGMRRRPRGDGARETGAS